MYAKPVLATIADGLRRGGAVASSSRWAPLGTRSFCGLLLAYATVNGGLWVHCVVSTWLLASMTASPATAALVQSATTLPVLLLVWPSGVVGDRVSRWKLLFAAHALMAVSSLAAALAVSQVVTTPSVLIGTAFAYALGSAVAIPVWRAIASDLVCPEQTITAVALMNSSWNVGRVAGATLAGLTLTFWGGASALALSASVSVGLAITLLLARKKLGCATMTARRRAVAEPVYQPETGSCVRACRDLSLCIVPIALATSAIMSLLPTIIQRQPDFDASVLGELFALFGVGATVAVLALGSHRQNQGWLRLSRYACFLLSASLAAINLPDYVVLAVGVLLAGFAWSVLHSILGGLSLAYAENGGKGKASGFYMAATYTGFTMGGLLWGLTAELTSIEVALALAAGLVLLGPIAMTAATSRLQDKSLKTTAA